MATLKPSILLSSAPWNTTHNYSHYTQTAPVSPDTLCRLVNTRYTLIDVSYALTGLDGPCIHYTWYNNISSNMNSLVSSSEHMELTFVDQFKPIMSSHVSVYHHSQRINMTWISASLTCRHGLLNREDLADRMIWCYCVFICLVLVNQLNLIKQLLRNYTPHTSI